MNNVSMYLLYKAIQNIVWKPSCLVLDEALVISRIIKDKENRELNMHCFRVWVRVRVQVHVQINKRYT